MKQPEKKYCVVPGNSHTRPPPQRRATSEGLGVQKEDISEGVAYRSLFSGGTGKIDKLSETNSCSVEQAISYFTVNGLLKQKLLFSSMIFYLGSAECFFMAYAINS